MRTQSTNIKMKPIFLYHDNEKAYANRLAYKNQMNALNELRITIQSSLKIELSIQDLQELSEDARGFIEAKKNLIRSTFQFPSASDHWNYESMGITFEPIDKLLQNLTNISFQYLINDEKTFIESKVELERLKNEANVYTQNDRQTEAVRLALELCEKLNELVEMGVIPPDNFGNIFRGTNGLIQRQENRYTFNPTKIKSL